VNLRAIRNLLYTLFLLLLLAACAESQAGQTYPDAPEPFKADDGTIAASNYGQTLDQPFTLGLGAFNGGSTPITLSSLKPVNLPPDVTLVATAIERPEENGHILLTAGNLGYPPIIDELHRPYIFRQLEQAIIHPQEFVEAVIALQSSKVGAYIVQGFLLTLEMNGKTYQHYYPTAAVLCVEVDHATCDAAVKQADDDYHNQQGH
jgi:hypothetical protein